MVKLLHSSDGMDAWENIKVLSLNLEIYIFNPIPILTPDLDLNGDEIVLYGSGIHPYFAARCEARLSVVLTELSKPTITSSPLDHKNNIWY